MAQRFHAIHRVRRAVVTAAVGAMLLAMATPPASAQDGARCTLPRLALPLFGGTPAAAIAATPQHVPSGTVGDEEVSVALEQIVACVNTGDPTLVYAVFTPRWLAEQFVDPETHYLPAFERMLDATAPVSGEPLVLTSVEAVEPLPDGRVRVGATFTSGARTWRDTLILVDSDGSWLIDEVESTTSP